MTFTLSDGYNHKYVIVGTNNQKFKDYPLSNGRGWNGRYWCVDIESKNIYMGLSEIAYWVNNELGEECLFEVE